MLWCLYLFSAPNIPIKVAKGDLLLFPPLDIYFIFVKEIVSAE